MALKWKIRSLCVEHGLTDETGAPSANKLAYKAGVWPTTAIGLLSDEQKYVSLDVLSRLAAIFGGVDKLMYDDGIPVSLAPTSRGPSKERLPELVPFSAEQKEG